ncbi:MAG: ATP-binding protein [Myxococcales bacterium]
MTEEALARRTVFVVDDSALDRERACKVLEGEYAVEAFADGSSVLERLAAGPAPDAVVLDWVMPGVSGIEVCRFLRSQRGMHEVGILLLTVYQRSPDQVVSGLEAGANDYVLKPFAEQELRARVGALVRTKTLIERAEKAEARVRKLLDYTPDALFAIDAQARFTYVNPEVERILDARAADLVGRPVSEVLPELPLQSVSAGPGEALFPLPDLRIRDSVYSPSIRILPGDDAASTTVSLRDVTAQRHAEARRLDFYSMIAHDLRSPLQAILMRLELINRGARGVLPAELLNDVRHIDGSTRALVTMINDFLDLARLEGTGKKIDQVSLDLAALVDRSVEELKPLAQAHHLSVRVEKPDGPALASGDQRRLLQVVANLLGNAIKFTPPHGSIVVRVSIGESFIETAVQDSGPGIEAALLPTLFDRFTRGPEAKGIPGSGLGLMIAREIVEAHGGTIGVNSQPGHGSVFWFRLPRAGDRAAGLTTGDVQNRVPGSVRADAH